MAATNGGFQATDDIEASKVPNGNEQATDNANNQTRRILEVDYRNTKHSAICSIIVFLALILILGAVIVVLIFLLDGQNVGPEREQQTELLRGPFIVSASITVVNLDYTEALSDPNSKDFIDLDDKFKNKLASVLSETKLKNTYRGVEITDVRAGSVIVDCLLLFCDPLTTADDVMQTILDTFTSQTPPTNAVDGDLIISNNNVNVEAASEQTTLIKLSCSATTQTTTTVMMSSMAGVRTSSSPMVSSPASTSTIAMSSSAPTSTPVSSSTSTLEPTSTPVVSSSTSASLSLSPATSARTATFEMSSVPQISTSAPPTSTAAFVSPSQTSTPTMTSETSTSTPVMTSIISTSVPSVSSAIPATSSAVSSEPPTSTPVMSSSTPVSLPTMTSEFTSTSSSISTPETAVPSSTTVTTTSAITSSPTLTLQPLSTVSTTSLILTSTSSEAPSSSAKPPLSSSVAGISTSLSSSMPSSVLSSNSLIPLPSASLSSMSGDVSMTSSMHVTSTVPSASNPAQTSTTFTSPPPSVTSQLLTSSETILPATSVAQSVAQSTSSQTERFTEAPPASTRTINVPTKVRPTMVTTELTPSAGTSQTAFTTSPASVSSLLSSMQLTTSLPSSSLSAIASSDTPSLAVSTSLPTVQSSASIVSSVTQSQSNSQIVQTPSAVTTETSRRSPSLDSSTASVTSTSSPPVMMSSVAMTTTPTQQTTAPIIKPSTEELTSTPPTTVPEPRTTVTSTLPPNAMCTPSFGVLENSTYFSSNDVINGATVDFECTWSYLSPVQGATIMVTFVTFDLGDDELKLRLGSDTRVFTGSALPSSVTTDANQIDITLVTNSNTNIVNFIILLELIVKDNAATTVTPADKGTQPSSMSLTTTLPACDPTNGVILTETSIKNITSPGYPRGYLNDLNCEWIYTKIAAENVAIYLEFISFDMGPDDYVEIETSGDDGMIVRYRGSVIPPSIRSYGMTMGLRFITDSAVTATGFAATIRLVSTTPTTATTTTTVTSTTSEPAQATQTDSSTPSRQPTTLPDLTCTPTSSLLTAGTEPKTLTSPGYPRYNYASDTECTWSYILIEKSETKAIQLHFNFFDVGDDRVVIDNDGLTIMWTGSAIPPDIVSRSDRVTIKLITNSEDNHRGFEVIISVVDR